MWQPTRRLPTYSLLCLLLSCGCAQRLRAPDLGELYNRAAQYQGADRNPIILIPGILGSRLEQTGSDATVWGAFTGKFSSPDTIAGARSIALPMAMGVPLGELEDDVVSVGALDRVYLSFFGLPLMIRAYAQILGILGVSGYRDEELGLAGAVDYGDDHFTCFQFHYDWRRDNVESAALLYRFIQEKKAYVREKLIERDGSAPDVIRFDIVAHSMGSLVARYMLRYGDVDLPLDGSLPTVTWKGAELVDKVVLIGAPNAGSLHAFLELTQGYQAALLLPRYEPALLGTFPSVYQLLPRTRHKPVVIAAETGPPPDLFDPRVWEEMQWGLAAPDVQSRLIRLLPDASPTERRHIAFDHLEKCLQRARQFTRALDAQAKNAASGLKVFLFVGDSIQTPAVATITAEGCIEVTGKAAGDGTVLRSSVLLDERVGGEWRPYVVTPLSWDQVFFLFTDHLGLTQDPTFADNLLHTLLEGRRSPASTP